MLGHSGDVPNETLVALGAPLEAAQFAISSAAARNDADERFVFLFSDANLERYGIRPVDLATVLTAEPRCTFTPGHLSSSRPSFACRLEDDMPDAKITLHMVVEFMRM
mmetsp:Transcript_2532/g.7150  ORF Transcript_2532/g.7150 Transcript_2532/m.7150 type:complete len:108 (-) Transcript_2532:1109-1432(-)